MSRFFLFYFGRRFTKPLFIEKSLCLLSVALCTTGYVVFDLQNQVKPSQAIRPRLRDSQPLKSQVIFDQALCVRHENLEIKCPTRIEGHTRDVR